MTFPTKSLNRLDNKGELLGIMGDMTGLAIFEFRRGMDKDLCLYGFGGLFLEFLHDTIRPDRGVLSLRIHLLLQIFMAGKTQIRIPR